MDGFLASRWAGKAPLETVFWRDMLMIGTVINVLMTAIAMALFAMEASFGLAMLVFFLPLPWNLFLVLSVWRAAEDAGEGGWMFQAAAVVWLAAMTLL